MSADTTYLRTFSRAATDTGGPAIAVICRRPGSPTMRFKLYWESTNLGFRLRVTIDLEGCTGFLETFRDLVDALSDEANRIITRELVHDRQDRLAALLTSLGIQEEIWR